MSVCTEVLVSASDKQSISHEHISLQQQRLLLLPLEPQQLLWLLNRRCVWWSAYYFYGLVCAVLVWTVTSNPAIPRTHHQRNPPSADHTAKLTWGRMRSSLHTLPGFCRELSLMAGPGGNPRRIGLLVSSVRSMCWKSIFENKALWKVVTDQNFSRSPTVRVHFHKWTLLKRSLLWG